MRIGTLVFENQAREYYRRHHMTEEPHPHDVKALERELHSAYVAGQETEDAKLRAVADAAKAYLAWYGRPPVEASCDDAGVMAYDDLRAALARASL